MSPKENRKGDDEALGKGGGSFGSLLRHVLDVVAILDADGTVRYVSPAVEAMLGYTPEEVTGTRVFHYVHPEDLERALEALAETLVTPAGALPPMEFRARCADGSWRHVEVVRNNRLDDPAVAGVVINVRDVTERKEAEARRREAEEKYRNLVERLPAIVYVQQPTEPGRTTYVSPQNEAILGYSPEECLADPDHWISIMHPEDRQRLLEEDERTNESGDDFAMEYRQFAKDGRWVWLRDEATLVRDEGGEPLYWLGVQTDVTQRKEAEEALRRSEASLAESQRIAHLGTWEWDLVTGEVWWSEETYRIHGLDPDEGMDLRQKAEEAFFPEDLPRYRRKIEEALSGEVEGYDHEHRIRRPDGEVRWVRSQAEVVRGEGGGLLRMIGTVHDVTERKVLEERLEHQAFHDPLTDLPNRRLFLDRLGQALRRTGRKKGRKVAVLFMDLDDFKSINDSLGHEAGDLLLVVVAQRLRRSLRPEDTLARFGGDEFVVLLEDVDGLEDAVRVAERIIEGFGGPFVLEGRELYARTSIGIALGKDRTERPEDLMRNADTAMYIAKGEGSGYKVFDPAMYKRAIDRLLAENDLRRAVERGEFVVHYQPIVDLQTGGVRALEAPG